MFIPKTWNFKTSNQRLNRLKTKNNIQQLIKDKYKKKGKLEKQSPIIKNQETYY